MVRIVGEKRRSSLWVAALHLGLFSLGLGACSPGPVLSLSNPPRSGFCVFPQGCYRRDCPCDGQGPGCRYLGPGTFTSAEPLPMDVAVLCQSSADGGADPDLVCTLPEMVCVAKGDPCVGSCVARSLDCSAPSSEHYPAQRRGGDGGMATYCPRVDQRCCPSQGGGDGGSSADGGPTPDAASPADLMSMPDA